MKEDRRRALEGAGFKVTTVKEFLGMTDEEEHEVEEKVAKEIYPKLVGQKFERLTITRIDDKIKRYKRVECLCDCGNSKMFYLSNITLGKTKSCGCLNIEKLKTRMTTHGLASHPLFDTWRNMIYRCHNEKNSNYKNYGGRGIKICNRWRDPNNFIEDLYLFHKENTTLDRIDNEGNYCPENCRWATSSQQMQNTRLGKNKYLGVSWHQSTKKWRANLFLQNKQVYLGLFTSEIEAAKAYDHAATLHFGPYAKVNFQKIRIRDDDILVNSSSYPDSFGRFKQIHEWICESTQFIHVPTILVKEIQQFPECIEYIRNETKEGRMLPEIHGHEHVDFAKISKEDLKEKFKLCKEFLWEKFEAHPRYVYSPWGASQPHLHEAAEECGLKLIDCSQIMKLEGKHGIVQRLKDGEDPSKFYGCEFFTHFWAGGARLKRIVEVFKHGSWEEAKKANRELFRD